MQDSSPTPYQLLAQLTRATGQPLRLRPFERVILVKVTDTEASALIDTYSVRELAREWRLEKHGTKMVSFKRDESTRQWAEVPGLLIWDEDFEPQTIVKFGKSVTPQQYREDIEFARDCYRPGTSRTPLDNYERVLDGPSTPAMERHW